MIVTTIFYSRRLLVGLKGEAADVGGEDMTCRNLSEEEAGEAGEGSREEIE